MNPTLFCSKIIGAPTPETRLIKLFGVDKTLEVIWIKQADAKPDLDFAIRPFFKPLQIVVEGTPRWVLIDAGTKGTFSDAAESSAAWRDRFFNEKEILRSVQLTSALWNFREDLPPERKEAILSQARIIADKEPEIPYAQFLMRHDKEGAKAQELLKFTKEACSAWNSLALPLAEALWKSPLDLSDRSLAAAALSIAMNFLRRNPVEEKVALARLLLNAKMPLNSGVTTALGIVSYLSNVRSLDEKVAWAKAIVESGMNLKESKAIKNALLIVSGSLSGKSLEETMKWAQALLKSRLPQHIVQCAVNLEPSCSVEEGIRLAHFLNIRELSTVTWAYSQAKALLNGKQTFFDHLLLVADSFYSHSKLPLGVIIKAVKKAMESSNELSKIKADVDQIIKDACQMAQAKAQHILGAGSELEQLGTLFILQYGHKATGKFLSLVQEARDGFQPVENQLSLKERVEILLYIKMHRGEWERELENDPPESFFHLSRTTSELVRSLSYQKGGERIIIHFNQHQEKGDRLVGKGATTRVKEGYDLVKKEKVALGTILNIGKKSARADQQIMQQLKGEHAADSFGYINSWKSKIVNAQGDVWNKDAWVMPLYEQTLKSYLKKQNPAHADLKELACQFLQGVKEFHEKGWIHRDLKPENTFVHKGVVKIGDFGMAICKHPGLSYSPYAGTVLYMAPEIASIPSQPSLLTEEKQERISFANDVWSAGITLWHLFESTGERLFQDVSFQDYKKSAPSFSTPLWMGEVQKSSPFSQEAAVIQEMLHPDPKERHSSEEAFKRFSALS